MQDLLEKANEFRKKYAVDSNRCCICNSDLAVQLHHVIPKHLGGPENGPLVPLCSGHHYFLHLVSNSKTTPQFPKLDQSALFKLKVLSRFILMSKLENEEMDPSFIPRKIMIEVPHALLTRMHKRKKDKGYSNLKDYITEIILNDTMLL